MTHDGYVATIELDEAAGLFHGEVVNTRDVLTFQGRTFDELKTAFADTITDYVEWCRERGKEPERPFSGFHAAAFAGTASSHRCRRRQERQERQYLRCRDVGTVDLERFPIKLNRTHPLPTSPIKEGGPVSAAPFVLPPPRWGRVGVGVMRAECIDSVENCSLRPPRRI
jgi:predicted HicB family RNase H-like nuclease